MKNRKKRIPLPTQARLEALFRYDYDTGNLIWKLSRGRAKAGDVAGNLNGAGYIMVQVDGVIYAAHRLVWVLTHGEEPHPDNDIDHINRHCADNRLKNLRIATHSANNRNAKKQKNNTSGVNGVSRNRQGWQAHIWADGEEKRKYFKRFEDACQHRWALEKEHEYDPSHGREPAIT